MGLFLSPSFPIMQVSLRKSAMHVSELKTKVKVNLPHSKGAESLYLEFCVLHYLN